MLHLRGSVASLWLLGGKNMITSKGGLTVFLACCCAFSGAKDAESKVFGAPPGCRYNNKLLSTREQGTSVAAEH